MQLRSADSASFSDLMAKKQAAGERKFENLRNMSPEERQALNERGAEMCLKIASEFGKSRRLVF